MQSIFLRLRLLSSLVVVALLSSCASGSQVKSSPQETTVYDKVLSSGKLRCGYVIYSPGCIKDANKGSLSGIGIEAIEVVAGKLGLKTEWTEEVGWGTMIEGLQTGRYDIVATPVWTNANRAKIVDFSDPIYFSPVFAYVKPGSKYGTKADLDWISSSSCSIATIDGETAELIAQEDFPNNKKVSLPQLSDISQMLLSVSTGKADLTFAEPAVAVNFQKSNPNAIKPVSENHPVRVFPNCWMFRRNQYEFKAMLDTVLSQLQNSGTIDRIVAKYEPAPGTLYRVAPPYQMPVRTATPPAATTGKTTSK